MEKIYWTKNEDNTSTGKQRIASTGTKKGRA